MLAFTASRPLPRANGTSPTRLRVKCAPILRALKPPRAEVPVGAIWVSSVGPAGEGADPENLETVRSVNGLAKDQSLQLSLSLGLTGLLGIDPKLRDHYSARFSDLEIVRIKDLSTEI